MPQRIQTPITGISTTSTYEDGATYSLVNLRPKNGALHPVSPRKVVQELSKEYDIIFIHQNNDYQNWIGVVNDGDSSSVYWDIKNDPKPIVENIQGAVNSVQQVGNTLSLITSDNVFYLLYQDENYRFLGELPQVPVINMKTSDNMPYVRRTISDEHGTISTSPDNFIEMVKGLVNKAMDILVNGDDTHEAQGLHLFDACFIRYAFRLYDGTLTKHSPPILILPTRHITGKTEEGNKESIKSTTYLVSGDSGSILAASFVEVYGYRIYINYDTSQLWNGSSWDDYSKWKDIIQSVDIFMSPPLGISNIENIRDDMNFSASGSGGGATYRTYNLIGEISRDAMAGHYLKSVSASYTKQRPY